MIAPRMLGTSEAKVNAIFDLRIRNVPYLSNIFVGLWDFLRDLWKLKFIRVDNP